MANYGFSIKQGMELAVSEINTSGGINGNMLIVVYEDSKSDARTGVNAFNKLVMMNNVPVVFGSLTSVILAIQPIADEKQVVLINSSAISPNIRDRADNFLFSIMVNGATEARFLAKEFQTKHPNEKITILYCNNASGVDTRNMIVHELELLGNTNVHLESYEVDVTNFKIQLDRIRRSQARYGYLLAYNDRDFAAILEQAKEINLDIQWFSYWGIETKETLDLAKDAANGVIYSYPKYDEATYSNLQSRYDSKFNSWADVYAITSYDGVHLIAEVMRRYGTSSIDIQTGLRSFRGYNGIFGDIDFTHGGKQYVERELFWKIIENNQFKVQE
jgi:branched-chain amino acid transport system substrate-binding protein